MGHQKSKFSLNKGGLFNYFLNFENFRLLRVFLFYLVVFFYLSTQCNNFYFKLNNLLFHTQKPGLVFLQIVSDWYTTLGL